MKRLLATALVVTAAATALPAAAQFAKPEDAIKYRQAAFTLMGRHFGSLGAMANGKAPFNAATAASDADVLAAVHMLPFRAFGEGTDLGKTDAKPEIWKEQAKFKQASENMDGEMTKLVAAAKSGSLDQLKAAFGPTAKTCKACHDHFRKD